MTSVLVKDLQGHVRSIADGQLANEKNHEQQEFMLRLAVLFCFFWFIYYLFICLHQAGLFFCFCFAPPAMSALGLIDVIYLMHRSVVDMMAAAQPDWSSRVETVVSDQGYATSIIKRVFTRASHYFCSYYCYFSRCPHSFY